MPENLSNSRQLHTAARSDGEPSLGEPLLELFGAERDAIVFLGLLSTMYRLPQSPPSFTAQGSAAQAPSAQAHSTSGGPLIHAAIIDNVDGEVLSLEANAVYDSHDPLQHAELRAIRAALKQLHIKSPRDPDISVQEYFETQLFHSPGWSDENFLHRGCTLYTSLEPCPMCSSTLLVARMKRTVFMVPDEKYGGAWKSLKDTYYADDALRCEALALPQAESMEGGAGTVSCLLASAWLSSAADIQNRLRLWIEEARGQGVRDALLFNALHGRLAEVWAAFQLVTPASLRTRNAERVKNLRTLQDFQQFCQIV